MAAVLKHVHFDPIEYIKKLRKVNFTQEQAEAVVEETVMAMDATVQQVKHDINHQELATKSDLAITELKLKLEIGEVRQEIEAMKNSMIKWIIYTGCIAVATLSGEMFTMFKLIMH